MLIGNYYIYDCQHKLAIPHLYKALEEIQILLSENNNEIKSN